jgi:hypothetical protein
MRTENVCRTYLAVMADSLDECVTMLKAWTNGMETKGLRVNMKKTSLWCMDLGWAFSVTLAPSLVLFVGVELGIIPFSAHNADCGFIRNTAMSVEDLSSSQTTSAQDAVARQDPLMADQSLK